MATLRLNLPDLYLTRLAFLEDVLMDEYDIEDGIVNSLFKVKDTDKPFVRTTTVATFGLVPTKAEGEDNAWDEMAQGFDKTYTLDTYELGFITSKEALDEDRKSTRLNSSHL